ncbi:MAG: acyl-CoA dehydrogenase C-terminal domain-containing protein [Alphaproteobacteria bacterium]|nr:acyl-CoA dehydrogenase C-terminal domain-containing protein [Alphaproteobacteria bacterium]
MSEYTAPLREMRFVLDAVAGIEALSELTEFEDLSSDLIDAILGEAGRFTANELAPLNHSGDKAGTRLENGVVSTPEGFKEAYAKFIEGGWGGVPFDPDYGGQGLPRAVGTAVNEMVATSNLSFSLCPMLTHGAVDLLVHHGSEEQKRTYLAKLISGEWSGTMNLTEPHAGSDVGALNSRAEPAGDHYRIKGTKIFITWGEHDMADNIIHMVLARTPDSPPGTKGISCFIVPKFLVNPDGSLGRRNDLRCVSLEHKLGINASPTAIMSFGESEGAIGYLIGEENEGMRCMFTMMNMARLDVGLEGIAIAERAFQQALAYARERVQGRPVDGSSEDAVPIVQHPDVRHMLMTMKAHTEATRALAYFTAVHLDIAERHPDEDRRRRSRGLVDLLTPVVKAWSTDVGVDVASIGIQVHGGMGFIEETGAAQHYRDARIAPIYEGTNGIQALDLVGRKLTFDGGSHIRGLLDDMRATADRLGTASNGLSGVADRLTAAVDGLAAATDWMIETRTSGNANEWAAGATDYQRMLGATTGGYLMARAAMAAERDLSNGGRDDAFLAAKITTARFYADHILPRAAALLGPVTRGSELLFAIDPEHMTH